jgi:glycosyltransferase involved in cell wall biosynthesis
MKLSILIPTLPKRKHFLIRLRNILDKQLVEGVEVIVDDRAEHIPTGIKRNDLISRAQGEYITFIDDDDLISHEYVQLIMAAIKQSPDVITFCGWISTDGGKPIDWVIKLGSDYVPRDGKYYRWPNHLSVMKKSIIKDIKFEPIWKQEDYRWSKIIHDRKILKSEVHINRQLYFYEERTRK